jgi:hypothetical protein
MRSAAAAFPATASTSDRDYPEFRLKRCFVDACSDLLSFSIAYPEIPVAVPYGNNCPESRLLSSVCLLLNEPDSENFLFQIGQQHINNLRFHNTESLREDFIE